MKKYIIIHGNPVDGFEFYGPFLSTEYATAFGERLGGEWWLKELVPHVTNETSKTKR